MAMSFQDLSIVEPRTNPFTGAELTASNIVSAGCCKGVGERVYQLEKNSDTDLQVISAGELSTGDFVVKFRAYPSADDDAIGFVFWRVDADNYLELRLGDLLLNKASLYRVANGVATEVVAETTVTSLTKQVAYVRVKINQATKQIQARVWLASAIEPTTWSITATLTQDVADTATGYGFSQAHARSVDWHWFSVSDVATELAYKTRIPANDTTTYPGGNLSVSGAAYYHQDDADGKGQPALSATSRLYHQKTGVILGRGTTDNSARFSLTGIKTDDNCYATFTPTDLDSSLESGIANLLMPALVPTDSHAVPAGAPSANPATFYLLHLRNDASNLARIGKTDGTTFTSSQLFGLGDKLTGYLGFDSSGAIIYGTWTITSLASVVAGRNYQLVYVDHDLPISTVIGDATYDDRVMYLARTAAPSTTATLTTQQESEVRGLITSQAGTLLDNLVECFITLGVERDSVIPSSLVLNNTNAVTVPNADTLNGGGCTAILISGYDPLIVDDNHLLLMPASTAGSAIPTDRRLTFRLSTNGVPSVVEIYVGHTAANGLLIARSSTTANITLSVIAASLSGLGTIDHIKAVIEAAAGAKKITQQAFADVAHTEFYEGTETVPPTSFKPDAVAASICIKESTHEMFYKQRATSSPITRRDELQFTTGANGYRLGFFGTADKVPNDILGFFFRGVSGSRGNFTIGLREDVLPTGISSAEGSNFQARWSTGTNTPTGAWVTFTRTRSVALQIDGHNYLYYGSPSTVGTIALGVNQAYTIQFRSTASGNAPINFYPASEVLPGTWRLLAGGSSMQSGGLMPNQVEDFAKTAEHDRVPLDKLPIKLEDFGEALSGDEGWVDDGTRADSGQVANALQATAPNLTQAIALTYGEYYENPFGYLQDNLFAVIRIPTNQLSESFRMVGEGAPDNRDPDDRYGDIYPLSSWTSLGSSGSYTYYYHSARIAGGDRLYIQRFTEIVIDTTKIDLGYSTWAKKGNTDLIPRTKLPETQFAQELLDSTRGYSIAQASSSSQQQLQTFTTALTLMSTDHGVMLVSLQASVVTGTLALGSVTESTTQVFLSVLRAGAYYDNSGGRRGNGSLVGTFDINNASGVKQGTIRSYIARNAANQVGTYSTYTAESGASGSLTGSIGIRWEVTLLRTDATVTSGGGATTLGGLSDVTITNPIGGQAIIRNSANTAWINRGIPSAQPILTTISGARAQTFQGRNTFTIEGKNVWWITGRYSLNATQQSLIDTDDFEVRISMSFVNLRGDATAVANGNYSLVITWWATGVQRPQSTILGESSAFTLTTSGADMKIKVPRNNASAANLATYNIGIAFPAKSGVVSADSFVSTTYIVQSE